MAGRQGSPATVTGANDPPEIGAATLTAGLFTGLEAAKDTGTRQQATEQPVNFAQHDKLTVIA